MSDTSDTASEQRTEDIKTEEDDITIKDEPIAVYINTEEGKSITDEPIAVLGVALIRLG